MLSAHKATRLLLLVGRKWHLDDDLRSRRAEVTVLQ